MASRTKQKEEARARRLAEEQARAERARRQQRIRIIGGTVLGAVIIVVALVLINSSGGKKGGLQTGTKANATVNSVNQLLTGIPQAGPVLGNTKAKVTMTYYGDYQCPVCKDFTIDGGFPTLVANEVRSGKVKVVYASFCTATCNGPDPNVFNTQQVAGLAAGKQNKFWQYTELFYRQQGQENTSYVSDKYLQGLARQISGLNLPQWQSDRNDSSLSNQVNTDQNKAKQVGVSGTPTLIFTGPKGQAVASSAVPSYAQLQQAIKQVS